jgi:hypothetical protein
LTARTGSGESLIGWGALRDELLLANWTMQKSETHLELPFLTVCAGNDHPVTKCVGARKGRRVYVRISRRYELCNIYANMNGHARRFESGYVSEITGPKGTSVQSSHPQEASGFPFREIQD